MDPNDESLPKMNQEDPDADSENEAKVGSESDSSEDSDSSGSSSSSSSSSNGSKNVEMSDRDENDLKDEENVHDFPQEKPADDLDTESTIRKRIHERVLRQKIIKKVNTKPKKVSIPDEDSDCDSNAPVGRSRSPSPTQNSAKNTENTFKEPKAEPEKASTSGQSQKFSRAGGAYLPPAKARLLLDQISDKQSEQYQRLCWDALKKSINGLVNKVNVGNISIIVRELFQENLVRGRGILAKSIMMAQQFSPTFTQVYAALLAVINTRLPQTGELLCKRLIVTFRKSFRRNDKQKCMLCVKFIAHLVNQNVCHEIIALEILSLLLQENPTDDAVEVSITFLKEVGFKLAELSPRGLTVVMERLRHILHEGQVGQRTQYAIEVMMAVRKDGFKEHLPIKEGLDLVEEEDQITHMLQLDGKYETQDRLNIFKLDSTFLENEANYKGIRDEILGSSDEENSDSSNSDSSELTSSEDELDDAKLAAKAAQARVNGIKVDIFDKTSTDIVHFRRNLYLTIQSSLDYEECAHKLLKINVGDDPVLIKEMCGMMIDCCQQQRTYEKFYGLLASRFCLLRKEFMLAFEEIVVEQYETIHRRDTIMLRNTSKMISHMLHSDALPWSVMSCIKISEDATSSSSRVFIKLLFQDLAECMGIPKLAERLFDETLLMFFTGLFPKDNPQDTRFAINFWTSIGLGALTEDLREHLKMIKANDRGNKKKKTEDGDSSESENNGGSDGNKSISSSSSSDSEPRMKKKRKNRDEITKRRRANEESNFFRDDMKEQITGMRRPDRKNSDNHHYSNQAQYDRENYREEPERRHDERNSAQGQGRNGYGNYDKHGHRKWKVDDDRVGASTYRNRAEHSHHQNSSNSKNSYDTDKYTGGHAGYKHRTEYETRGDYRKRQDSVKPRHGSGHERSRDSRDSRYDTSYGNSNSENKYGYENENRSRNYH